MSVRHSSVVILVILALAGCSASPSAATSAPPAASTVSAAAAPAAAATSAATSSATKSSVPPAAGGGATDFCSAYQEYKDAVNADTPQLQGAGFRAAATDLRTFAPAEIKGAANLFADVMDEVGQTIAAGGPNPEILTSGQSAERRQGAADSITWINKNCPS